MTKKDYELIARMLSGRRGCYPPNSEARRAVDDTARQFAREFATLNPRFNREIFLRACGVEVK